MALTITEEWIRERVKLKHNNLEDVRSLSLPGTYHEKIGSLGDSVRNFTRLKCLDLSRNAIESLQGLENLKMLEKLILYYNNVPSLQELYRLRHNQRLLELDLRLNAVARNEPDYRLFLIHMLPNLRRLDDRAVRDSERKAALMHYSTDQAAEFTEHAPRPLSPPQQANPRAEQVRALARPPNVVENDDAVLLDYASKTREELWEPRPITGSASARPQMEEYPAEVARQMDRSAVFSAPPPTLPTSQTQPEAMVTSAGPAPLQAATMATTQGSASSQLDDLLKRYPNLVAPPNRTTETASSGKKNGVRFSEDPNLKFQDEIEAYTSYKAKGHFTPHPDQPELSQPLQPPLPPPEGETVITSEAGEEIAPTSLQRTAELYRPQDVGISQQEAVLPLPTTTRDAPGAVHPPQTQPMDDRFSKDLPLTGTYGLFVTRVSDLVDKYWNGAKSLVKSTRFKHHMNDLYKELSSGAPQNGNLVLEPPPGSEVAQLQSELSEAREENARLRQRALASLEAAAGGAETASSEGTDGNREVRGGSLIRAQRDVSLLRGRLQKSIEENKRLQEKITVLEAGQTSAPGGRAGVTTGDIESIGNENERLRGEITSLGIRLKQANQMQELAAMLQQSHKSLVETNEHLLRELNEARRANDGRLPPRREYAVAASGVPPTRSNTEAGKYVATQSQIPEYPTQKTFKNGAM